MTNFLSFSFKNRIAFNYILSSSILIAIVFIFIYGIVNYSVNQHVNNEISNELLKHLDDVTTDSNDTYLIQVDQWRAREHNSIKVNPVFVEFYDNNKQLIDKSPNLTILICNYLMKIVMKNLSILLLIAYHSDKRKLQF